MEWARPCVCVWAGWGEKRAERVPPKNSSRRLRDRLWNATGSQCLDYLNCMVSVCFFFPKQKFKYKHSGECFCLVVGQNFFPLVLLPEILGLVFPSFSSCDFYFLIVLDQVYAGDDQYICTASVVLCLPWLRPKRWQKVNAFRACHDLVVDV